jgi:type I restriction enzyme S subunit
MYSLWCVHALWYLGLKKSKSFISTELASKLRTASRGDVVFVAAGETIEDIGKGTAWLGDEDIVITMPAFFTKAH